MKDLIKICIFLLFLTVVGCKQPSPTPELMDPIYNDLVAEKALAIKNLEEQKKQLVDLEKQYLDIKPQSGQVKSAQRKAEDARLRLHKFKQQVLYFEVKVANRKLEARKKYKIAFLNNQEWPDKNETDQYMGIQKLRRDKIISESKARVPAENGSSSSPE